MQRRDIAMMDVQKAVDACTSKKPARDVGCFEYVGYDDSGRRIKVILNEISPRAALLITTYPV
jgi:hypothetical protein